MLVCTSLYCTLYLNSFTALLNVSTPSLPHGRARALPARSRPGERPVLCKERTTSARALVEDGSRWGEKSKKNPIGPIESVSFPRVEVKGR